MVSLAVAASLLTQTAPSPEAFTLTEVTVSDVSAVWSTSDLHRVGFRRTRVTMADGAESEIYISSFVQDRPDARVGDICTFEGTMRPWVGSDRRGDDGWPRYEAPPPDGTLVRMVDRHVCRPGPASRPESSRDAGLISQLPPDQTSTITVVGIGPKPGWASGIAWTSILILGQSADGDIDPYFLTYHGEQEPVPPLGGRCTILHAPYRLELVGGLQARPGLKGELFEDFECIPPPEPDFELFREDPAP